MNDLVVEDQEEVGLKAAVEGSVRQVRLDKASKLSLLPPALGEGGALSLHLDAANGPIQAVEGTFKFHGCADFQLGTGENYARF